MRVFYGIILIAFLGSCSVLRNNRNEKILSKELNNSLFSSHHTGFSLFDLESKKFIVNHNANLLYTPASNTKLVTMYLTLKNFEGAMPALLYAKTDGGVVVEPIGDPSFLYDLFPSQPVYDFLADKKSITILKKNHLQKYGPGWAWEDAYYDFQVYQSWWPIYGNKAKVCIKESILSTEPAYFESFVKIKKTDSLYQLTSSYPLLFSDTSQKNPFDYNGSVPFEYSDDLFEKLLKDTLQINTIEWTHERPERMDTLLGHHSDTLIRPMLRLSDNFLADQLLLLCAWKNGFKEIAPYLQYEFETSLDFMQEARLVDGSGLSRYNLLSPNNQIELLERAVDEFGWERVTHLLSVNGKDLLRNYPKSITPIIYAKTGTVSNNHNLSGYIVSKTGKKMIFSLMNNHFTRPKKEIKEEMKRLLLTIWETY